MKINDLRKKTEGELAEELLGLRKEQFNLRMQRATGQLSRPDQFDKVSQEHRTDQDPAERAVAAEEGTEVARHESDKSHRQAVRQLPQVVGESAAPAGGQLQPRPARAPPRSSR